jgi:hypothetical protein
LFLIFGTGKHGTEVVYKGGQKMRRIKTILQVFTIVVVISGCHTSSPTYRPEWVDHTANCVSDECLIISWRKHQISVEEADREINLPNCHPDFRQHWRKFISNYKPEYQLWFYCAPEHLWENGMGSEGYAIFDSDHLISDIITVSFELRNSQPSN